MKLSNLTLAQIKNVESVRYQDIHCLDDNDFVEFMCLHIKEDWGDDPEIDLDEETLIIYDRVVWFEERLMGFV